MDAMVHRWGRRDEVEAFLGQSYTTEPYDCAIFADTREEPRAVYDHLLRLKAMDTVPILEGTIGKLGDHLIQGVNSTGQRYASVPVFIADSNGEKRGMAHRQCTSEYKVKVVERIIRRSIFGLPPGAAVPRDGKAIQVFGLSWDEPNRIAKPATV